jgi:EAL domain-containing protein (putative c-di-GMP-specific phosphodiesterase class I)
MTDHESKKYRILLVDDDPAIRRDFTKMIRSFGFVTETACNGQEAVDHIISSRFDVILSDINMPRMGGLEFLRMVRNHDLDVPVVLMTGQPDLQSAIEAIEYGAFQYLIKPVHMEKLEQVLQRAVIMNQMAKLKREAIEVLGSEGKQLGDRASLDARFTNALEHLWIAFQPIVRWPERIVFAYEALVRSKEPTLKNATDILDAAERLGRIHDLGQCIREQVVRLAPEAPSSVLFFVNLHPLDLNDFDLFSPTSPLSAMASRVVLEITERVSLKEVSNLTTKIEKLRSLGFRIAIDDLGAGYAGLSCFSQLNPEFVKFDISLVSGLDKSIQKRSLVHAMANFCMKDLGIEVVCEGVERPEERNVLLQEGCHLQQGYLFAKPDRSFPIPQW